MCLALSISEVASAYPTSGAMYFTIKYLAPAKYVPIIAWIDGTLPSPSVQTAALTVPWLLIFGCQVG
jgi:amino acid transporter